MRDMEIDNKKKEKERFIAGETWSRRGSQPARQPASEPSSPPASQQSNQPASKPASHPEHSKLMDPDLAEKHQKSLIWNMVFNCFGDACEETVFSHPATQPSSQQASQPTSRPASQPASKPYNQSASQSARPAASQQVGHPARLPAIQPASKPTNQFEKTRQNICEALVPLWFWSKSYKNTLFSYKM